MSVRYTLWYAIWQLGLEPNGRRISIYMLGWLVSPPKADPLCGQRADPPHTRRVLAEGSTCCCVTCAVGYIDVRDVTTRPDHRQFHNTRTNSIGQHICHNLSKNFQRLSHLLRDVFRRFITGKIATCMNHGHGGLQKGDANGKNIQDRIRS